MAFSYTPVFTDNCSQSQGTQLPTADYHIVGSLAQGDDIPEYSGRFGIYTTIQHLGDGQASMIPALAADQYIRASVMEWSQSVAFSAFWFYLRAGSELTPSYAMFIANENGGSGGFFNFLQYDANSNIVYQWFANDKPISNVLGSAITFGVVQPKHNGVAQGHPMLVLLQNSTTLATGDLTLSPGGIIASGRAGFQINALDGNGNHGTSSFETGIGGTTTKFQIGNFFDNV